MNTHVWRNAVTTILCMTLSAFALRAEDGELAQELDEKNDTVNVAEEEVKAAEQANIAAEKAAAERAAHEAKTAKLKAARQRAAAEAARAEQVAELFQAVADERLGGPEAKELIEKAAKKREERNSEYLEAQRERDQELVDLKIEDLTRVCQLAEKQVKKLQLAAKGSIDRRISKIKADMNKAQEKMGERLGLQLAGRGNGAVEFIAAAQAGMMQVHSKNASPVFESALWKKAFEKTLSDDQKKAYQKSKDERAKRARQLQVQSYVAELDAMLYLSDKQRSKLVTLLNDSSNSDDQGAKAAVRVEAGANRARVIRQGNVQVFFADGNATVSSSNFHPTAKQRKEIQQVLTEKQQAVWKNSGKTRVQRGNAFVPAARFLNLNAR